MEGSILHILTVLDLVKGVKNGERKTETHGLADERDIVASSCADSLKSGRSKAVIFFCVEMGDKKRQ